MIAERIHVLRFPYRHWQDLCRRNPTPTTYDMFNNQNVMCSRIKIWFRKVLWYVLVFLNTQRQNQQFNKIFNIQRKILNRSQIIHRGKTHNSNHIYKSLIKVYGAAGALLTGSVDDLSSVSGICFSQKSETLRRMPPCSSRHSACHARSSCTSGSRRT